jgi:hypothetical protein
MTTLSLTLQPRVTKVYDSDFLTDTKRAFARWELAYEVVLPQTPTRPAPEAGIEETIAETFDKRGKVLGRWIVSWGENGEGKCRAVGNVVRLVKDVIILNNRMGLTPFRKILQCSRGAYQLKPWLLYHFIRVLESSDCLLE